jgi:hypothetical protein
VWYRPPAPTFPDSPPVIAGPAQDVRPNGANGPTAAAGPNGDHGGRGDRGDRGADPGE